MIDMVTMHFMVDMLAHVTWNQLVPDHAQSAAYVLVHGVHGGCAAEDKTTRTSR